MERFASSERMKRIFATCAALLFSSQAFGDEVCQRGTQLEMNRCAAQYRAAEKAERKPIKRVKRAQPAAARAVAKAQWHGLRTRDADCAQLFAWVRRAAALQPRRQPVPQPRHFGANAERFVASLLQCEEGDLSCHCRQPVNARESRFNNNALNAFRHLVKSFHRGVAGYRLNLRAKIGA